MTYDKFMLAITAYYGKYENDFTTNIVLEFIKENLNETELDAGIKKLITSYKYKKPPKVVDIKNILCEGPEVKAEKAWMNLVNQSCLDDVLIVDEYSYMAVKGYGSWMRFCENMHTNGDWVHKDFIKRYCMFFESGTKESPKVLSGSIQSLYGGSNYKTSRKIKIIGDIEKGKLLLKSDDSNKIDLNRIKIL